MLSLTNYLLFSIHATTNPLLPHLVSGCPPLLQPSPGCTYAVWEPGHTGSVQCRRFSSLTETLVSGNPCGKDIGSKCMLDCDGKPTGLEVTGPEFSRWCCCGDGEQVSSHLYVSADSSAMGHSSLRVLVSGFTNFSKDMDMC